MSELSTVTSCLRVVVEKLPTSRSGWHRRVRSGDVASLNPLLTREDPVAGPLPKCPPSGESSRRRSRSPLNRRPDGHGNTSSGGDGLPDQMANQRRRNGTGPAPAPDQSTAFDPWGQHEVDRLLEIFRTVVGVEGRGAGAYKTVVSRFQAEGASLRSRAAILSKIRKCTKIDPRFKQHLMQPDDGAAPCERVPAGRDDQPLAEVNHPEPDDRRPQLFTKDSLNAEQQVIYDEVEGTFVRIFHTCRDFRTRKRASKRWLTKTQLEVMDALIHTHFDWENLDPLQLNCLAYAAVQTFAEPAKRTSDAQSTLAKHQRRVKYLRKAIGQLDAELRHKTHQTSRRRKRLRRRLKHKYGTLDRNVLTRRREELVSKVRVRATKIRLLKKSIKRKNAALAYGRTGRLPRSNEVPEQHPSAEEVQTFWGNIAKTRERVDLNDHILTDWAEQVKSLAPPEVDEWIQLEEGCWQQLIRKLKPWKAPGPDCVQAYFWKNLSNLREAGRLVTEQLLNGREVPDDLVAGRTLLIPKGTEGLQDPAKYRPIACLNVQYKLLTSAVNAILLPRVIDQNLLPTEQRALRPGVWGTMDCLIADEVINRYMKARGEKLYTAWIDYQKAFDSVPHTLILWLLRTIGANPRIQALIETLMPKWKTVYSLRTPDGYISTEPIVLQRGVFQGDTLSVLLFCLTMGLVSHALQTEAPALRVPKLSDTMSNHLFYVDDLKVYARTRKELDEMLIIVRQISTCIGMTLGLNKCGIATNARKRGNQIWTVQGIPQLTGNQSYKYLGVKQKLGHGDLPTSQNEVRQVLKERIREISRANLNSKQTAKALNSLVVGKARYYLAAGLWTRPQVPIKLDRFIRHELTKRGLHYWGASIERLYLPREKGGRGLTSMAEAHDAAALALMSYCQTAVDPFPRTLWRASQLPEIAGRGTLYTRAQKVVAHYPELSLVRGTLCLDGIKVEQKDRKRLTKLVKESQEQERIQNLTAKSIHGTYYSTITTLGVKECSAWLIDGGLNPTDEARLVLAQDGTLRTRKYRFEVLGEEVDPKCRLCGKRPESVGHIVSACEHSQFSLFKDRHDESLQPVINHLCKQYGMKGIEPRKRVPARLENEKVKILWDPLIATVGTVTARRPDMEIFLKEENTIIIAEMTCPWDARLTEAYQEKWVKYRPLVADLKTQFPQWRIRQSVLVMGALGSHERERMMEQLKIISPQAKEDEIGRLLNSVQRATLLGTSRVIRNHLVAE